MKTDILLFVPEPNARGYIIKAVTLDRRLLYYAGTKDNEPQFVTDYAHAKSYKSAEPLKSALLTLEKRLEEAKQEENAQNAHKIGDALRKFAENPEAIENFENYLERHFSEWLEKYAGTPDGLAAELERFSEIY